MAKTRRFVIPGLLAGFACLPYLVPLTRKGDTPPEALAGDGHFVRIQGHRLYHRTAGAGPPVVGIPGFGGNVREWDEAFAHLTPRFALTVVDPLGSGLSDRPWDADYAHPTQARRLFSLMDALHIERAHVIGHSWGANIAVHMALAHPERVRCLVLLTPGFFRPTSFPIARFLLRVPPIRRAARVGIHLTTDMERRIATNYVDAGRAPPDLVERWRPAMETPRWADAYLLPLRDSGPNNVQQRLKELKMPIHIIFAEQDRVFPLHSQLARTKAALPHATIDVIPDAAHHVLIERPDVVYGRVAEFLLAGHATELSG
jgi:pimeloyl-ACP methyl ester carboxylesterase